MNSIEPLDSRLIQAADVMLLGGHCRDGTASVFAYEGDDTSIAEDVPTGDAGSALTGVMTERADACVLRDKERERIP